MSIISDVSFDVPVSGKVDTSPYSPVSISTTVSGSSTVSSDEHLSRSSQGNVSRDGDYAGPLKQHDKFYELLFGKAIEGKSLAILFGWWPRSHKWTEKSLVERTTRVLPAVRPQLDLVALPDLPDVHELWEVWSECQGLEIDQAVWFSPRLGQDAVENASLATFKEVMSSASVAQLSQRDFYFYPMYVTPDIASEAAALGVSLIGDLENHKLMDLSSAKAWLHPVISDDGQERRSSLRDVLPPDSHGARGPFGYVATSLDSLQEAWRRLKMELPEGAKLVLKPAGGSGGTGVVLDAQFPDLKAFDFGNGHAILEEMIVGVGSLPSPCLYMTGNTPCGHLADQLLEDDGVTNVGNRYPSKLQSDLLPVCVDAAQKINSAWKLSSNWGLDFVLDASGTPIVVDLNMGRPNGNFAVRLWTTQQKWSSRISLRTLAWQIPLEGGPSVKAIVEVLRSNHLLWNKAEGVLVYQHVRGAATAFAVASVFGDNALLDIQTRLRSVMKTHFGIYISEGRFQ